ncbi:FAD-dependent monooxygenase [Nonomuraea sp. NPDC047897]|uniref:FAD-dependent monooxygenase n=1 Tax=Nonomuraea sp. NPDC047897 TaxID=3364346 RepID=UPI003715871A
MSADVIIAGGGPNGLMLACELSLAGVRPVVLDRLPARTTENRANGLVGQVVRMLDRRGLYEPLSGDPGPPRPAPHYMFGALPLDLSSLDDNPLCLLPVPQLRVEEVLERRATELGAEIRRGHELVGLAQDDAGVTAVIEGPGGGYRLRARHLVGADGGHSVTRKLAGIGFPGVTRDDTVSRTAHVSVPAELIDPETGGLDVPGYGLVPPFMHHRTDRGLFAYAPFPSRPAAVTTLEWGPAGEQGPMTLDELRRSVRRVLGVDLPLCPPVGEGPHLSRRLTGGSTRLADRYRAGRVLLAGDAAHVHSAIGGPGLNLGLQDTVNLGWKLAAEIHGWAPPGLLDTYESERRPVARRVVMHTRAQTALIAPGGDVTALREVFAELLGDRDTVGRMAGLLAGSDVGYAMGPDDGHPLTGRWAPELVLDLEPGRVRLAELTRNARPLLLDLTEDACLAEETSGWADRVDAVIARTPRPTPAGTGDGSGVVDRAATALLLRPDCHVAWATDSARPGPGERAALRAALTRWFGPAA